MSNIIFEITGLKPGEHFAIKGHELVTPDYWIDEMGVVWTIGKNGPRETGSSILAAILTETYRIIRKPRLTGEQIEHLKALNLLGFNYLFEANYGAHIASISKPVYARNAWGAKMCKIAELPKEWLFFSLLKENNGLVDIVQTLKDAEVEG